MDGEPINSKNTFKDMLYMQIDLLNQYIPIEGLPSYPLDLNVKSNQKVIRDFVRRILEELVEAHMELIGCLNFAAVNDIESAKVLQKNFNIEMADAMHFWLELLIYSGIDTHMMDSIIYQYISNSDRNLLSLYTADDIWGTVLRIGSYYNANVQKPRTGFIIRTTMERSEEPEYSGGAIISSDLIDLCERELWHLTCNLLALSNELKNRDHHLQEDRDLDKVKYWDKVLFVMITFAQIFDLVGITKLGMYRAYAIKNKINHERITSGY